MENVIDLVQVKFVKAFNEIQRELEELGYTNYNEVLNAKDFEIPQSRKMQVSAIPNFINKQVMASL